MNEVDKVNLLEIDTKNKKQKSIVDLEEDLEGEHDTYKFFRYVSDIIPNNRFLVDENPAKPAGQVRDEEAQRMANFDDEKDKSLLERVSRLEFKGRQGSIDADNSIQQLFDMSKKEFESLVDAEDDDEEKLSFLDQIERDIQREKVMGQLNTFGESQEAARVSIFDDTDSVLDGIGDVDPIRILEGISLEEKDSEANTPKNSLPPVYIQQEREGVHTKKLQAQDEVVSLEQLDFETRELVKTNYVYLFGLPYDILGTKPFIHRGWLTK